MKTFLTRSSVLFLVLVLAGCSASSVPVPGSSNDDHHEGETNVQPHDDDVQQETGDHHEGETNVQPHDDEPSAAKPPSRSNPVEDHDDAETDPHGH